jgi:hypothetical protein
VICRERSRGREQLFGFASLEFPGLMQIARVMAVKIVFNSTRIACADSRTVAYDHAVALTMDSPRKRASGSVGLNLIPLRCHCRRNLRNGNSRRPRGISLVDLSLVRSSSYWTPAKSWNSRKSEVGIFGKTHPLLESTGSGKYIGVGIGRARQILVLLNAD